MLFFNFLNFFAIFLEFSFTPRVRMERKDNFYFLSFAAFPCLFSLEMKPQRYFWILEFSITHRVGTERNETINFISLFPTFFQPTLAWNEFIMVFFNFLEFSITHRAGTKRNNNFYFLSFSASSNLFWHEMTQ